VAFQEENQVPLSLYPRIRQRAASQMSANWCCHARATSTPTAFPRLSLLYRSQWRRTWGLVHQGGRSRSRGLERVPLGNWEEHDPDGVTSDDLESVGRQAKALNQAVNQKRADNCTAHT